MNHECVNCGKPLVWFGMISFNDVFECVKCGKAWYYDHSGLVEEVAGWRE